MKKEIRKIAQYSQNKWLYSFVRLGYVVRGILYGIIGIVALEIVLGLQTKAAGITDVISIFHTLFLGQAFLVLIVAGLVGYSLWGIMRASLDFINPKVISSIPPFTRLGYLLSAFSYASLIIPSLFLLFNIQSPTGINNFNQRLIGLFTLPYGLVIVFIIGLAFIIAGFHQAYRVLHAKKPIDLWFGEKRKEIAIPFMIVAKIGICVRGAIFILIGYFICLGAIRVDPSEVKGVEGIQQILAHMYGGPVWLTIIGLGLILFAMYSILLSRWVELP